MQRQEAGDRKAEDRSSKEMNETGRTTRGNDRQREVAREKNAKKRQEGRETGEVLAEGKE